MPVIRAGDMGESIVRSQALHVGRITQRVCFLPIQPSTGYEMLSALNVCELLSDLSLETFTNIWQVIFQHCSHSGQENIGCEIVGSHRFHPIPCPGQRMDWPADLSWEFSLTQLFPNIYFIIYNILFLVR